jgi:hypothetical protein
VTMKKICTASGHVFHWPVCLHSNTMTVADYSPFLSVLGFYIGRVTHFHIKAYMNGAIAENGTFIVTDSEAHTGQLFFDQVDFKPFLG